MSKEISFENMKIEAENHGFRNVEIKATFGNGGYVVFQYTPAIDPNKRSWAAIKINKQGKFAKANFRDRNWILNTNPMELLEIFGEVIYKK